MKLRGRNVEKPWGRTGLPGPFPQPRTGRVGEIVFEGPPDLPLLAKYIFTSERLSIQVHPDDREARTRGVPHGKSECWVILDAEPGSVLGLGLTADVSRERLRAAAQDGSIEGLLAWREVSAGDVYFVPAGTVHAIGGGIALLELQQNCDVTYRLYDYGRPRELHLEDGVAVADPGPWRPAPAPPPPLLVDAPPFRLWRIEHGVDPAPDHLRWVLPWEGNVESEGEGAGPGECLLVEPGAPLAFSAGSVVFVGSE